MLIRALAGNIQAWVALTQAGCHRVAWERWCGTIRRRPFTAASATGAVFVGKRPYLASRRGPLGMHLVCLCSIPLPNKLLRGMRGGQLW